MDESLAKQLYDFLNSYELIQANLNEDEAIKEIENALKRLKSDENTLTGLIAHFSQKNSEDIISAALVTDKNRIIFSSEELEELDLNQLNKVEENELINLLETENPDLNLKITSLEQKGSDSINDALYTVSSELLPTEKVKNIFDLNDEEIKESEQPESQKDYEVIDIEIDQPEEENTNLDTLQTAEIEPVETNPEENESETFEIAPAVEFDNLPEEVAIKEEKETKKTKKPTSNKPVYFILGGILIVLLGFLIYNLVSNNMKQQEANEQASQLIEYFNQIDEIYDQAAALKNAGIGGSTVEQWQALESQAENIQSELSSLETGDLANNVYQSVYFYNDALLTALYYGRMMAQTSQPVQLTNLTSRLETADSNRISALSYLYSEFPDLKDQINNQTDIDSVEGSYPNSDEIQKKIEEADSKPSEGAENRENTESSNEARENSHES